MNVEISHHIDASDLNPEGFYDYHYEYDIYVFSDGPLSYVVRAYTDQPEQAAFMSVSKGSSKRLLRSNDFRTPLLAEAVAYLRNAEKTDLSWLCEKRGRYLPITDTDDGRKISRLWRWLWWSRHAALALSLLIFVSVHGYAAELPPLTGRVVDNAGVIDSIAEEALTNELQSLENKTSDQLVVVTIPDLDGEPIEAFSTRLFNTWKLGQKQRDNGVLLVVAPKDRKVRIEVGYGLEHRLTNTTAKRIIESRIIPKFRAGDLNGGIKDGVTDILAVLSDDRL
ncbi:YgcG family protein [Phyllobacterium sp. TAF24]|uniref:TPM domain-containing protein n=1 Tax=Phyllobacterium sp. TAF24 TaxID=3233068 RepID=UPI003F9CACD6